MKRRSALHRISGLGLALVSPARLSFSVQSILKRPIPATGELLPCIGVGTWRTFDVGNAPGELQPLRDVLRAMIDGGATVIDSSPMYGRSEEVVGKLSAELAVNQKLFIATKVWTSGYESGISQMNNSFNLLGRKTIDLMQIHNLLDWETHLKTLQEWKEQGRVRYIGLTHYLDSMHEKVEDIIAKHSIDFIQINYNISNRHAEERLLPAATDHNVAVIVNRPFQEGELFQKVQGQSLPSWAADIGCTSWAQFFLKFIISHPSVTCAIPGTSKVKHLLDNLKAAEGRLPDMNQREKMADLFR
jgi:diketogulonate reductase-like aldo/keto reductase